MVPPAKQGETYSPIIGSSEDVSGPLPRRATRLDSAPDFVRNTAKPNLKWNPDGQI